MPPAPLLGVRRASPRCCKCLLVKTAPVTRPQFPPRLLITPPACRTFRATASLRLDVETITRQNHYERLGVKPDATPADIKRYGHLATPRTNNKLTSSSSGLSTACRKATTPIQTLPHQTQPTSSLSSPNLTPYSPIPPVAQPTTATSSVCMPNTTHTTQHTLEAATPRQVKPAGVHHLAYHGGARRSGVRHRASTGAEDGAHRATRGRKRTMNLQASTGRILRKHPALRPLPRQGRRPRLTAVWVQAQIPSLTPISRILPIFPTLIAMVTNGLTSEKTSAEVRERRLGRDERGETTISSSNRRRV
jgi:hypothetical protein